MLPGRAEAPTRATERGQSTARKLSAAAVQDRWSLARSASSVSSMGNQACTTPSRDSSATRNPSPASTSSMRTLSPWMSASKRSMPFAAAMRPRCSSRRVPTPRPW